jgi:hypothetical protein
MIERGTAYHAEAAQGRWQAMSLVEQMANIGSEVDRAIRAHTAEHRERFDHALARGLELFDLTAADDRWTGPRRREVLRAREEFCRLFFDAPADPASVASLQRYFLYYAIAARPA